MSSNKVPCCGIYEVRSCNRQLRTCPRAASIKPFDVTRGDAFVRGIETSSQEPKAQDGQADAKARSMRETQNNTGPKLHQNDSPFNTTQPASKAPTLAQLNHQLELSNPSDLIRRRLFGPYALLRSHIIDQRMEYCPPVQRALQKYDDEELERQQGAPQYLSTDQLEEVDPAKARQQFEQDATRTAYDLLIAQTRGVKEAGDLERIVGVAQQNEVMARMLASERLWSGVVSATSALGRMDKLRALHVYCAFLTRQNGTVHYEVVWPTLLASARAMHANALQRYLDLWLRECQRVPQMQTLDKVATLFLAMQEGVGFAPHRANAENAALMNIVTGSLPSAANSKLDSGISAQSSSIKSMLYDCLRLKEMNHGELLGRFIALLQTLGATNALLGLHEDLASFSSPHVPGSSTSSTSSHTPLIEQMTNMLDTHTSSLITRALFKLSAHSEAWRLFRLSGFKAGLNRNFDKLLLAHAASRPDFVADDGGWNLSEEEGDLLERRLEAQRQIMEDRLCKRLGRELEVIERMLGVRWIEKQGVYGDEELVGWHVWDTRSDDDEGFGAEKIQSAGG